MPFIIICGGCYTWLKKTIILVNGSAFCGITPFYTFMTFRNHIFRAPSHMTSLRVLATFGKSIPRSKQFYMHGIIKNMS